MRAQHVSSASVQQRACYPDALTTRYGVVLDGTVGVPSAQDTQRLQAESEQGKSQADFDELEEVIAGLAAEKLEMESTLVELMMRLEAASKHTQALADERTFLQVNSPAHIR
eukprot:COSAG02_NODE_5748_length_4069_cov_2.955416_3_plen_112_part_00